jgi:hypothetical protein
VAKESRISTRVAVLALVVLISACAPVPLYEWGGYEDSLYRTLVHPDTNDLATQSARLAADIERTSSLKRRVPPGVHAHLGYLYFMQGRADEALAQFEAERAAFPESTVFIDGMIARMKRPASGPGAASPAASQPVAPAAAAPAPASSPAPTAPPAASTSPTVPVDDSNSYPPSFEERP